MNPRHDNPNDRCDSAFELFFNGLLCLAFRKPIRSALVVILITCALLINAGCAPRTIVVEREVVKYDTWRHIPKKSEIAQAIDRKFAERSMKEIPATCPEAIKRYFDQYRSGEITAAELEYLCLMCDDVREMQLLSEQGKAKLK
jgi:hypothetical protein